MLQKSVQEKTPVLAVMVTSCRHPTDNVLAASLSNVPEEMLAALLLTVVLTSMIGFVPVSFTVIRAIIVSPFSGYP
jgi:hypothetical protein